MSLTVHLPIADGLRSALAKLKDPDGSTRSAVVVIENETLVLSGDVFEATESLTKDLTVVRDHIRQHNIPAAYVIVKLDIKQHSQILYVPDGIKPKLKMTYASAAGHLREESKLAIPTDTHVTSLDEINPTLFGRDIEADREELMTDQEKVVKELSAMEVAPQKPTAPTGMPGVANPINEEGLLAVQEFKSQQIRGAIFAVTPKGIVLDSKHSADLSVADVIKASPEGQPRFLVLNWPQDKTVLLYVCPTGLKPKERMPYASSKASFVAQLAHQEVKLSRSVETDDVATAEAQIKEALEAPQLEETVAPIAPKSVMPKGPRMLI